MISVTWNVDDAPPPVTRRLVVELGGRKATATAAQVQAVLDAISVAIEMDGESSTYRAKYHEPSGLLILRGTQDELGVAAQVFETKVPELKVPRVHERTRRSST